MRPSDYIWTCRQGSNWFRVRTPKGRTETIGPFPAPHVLFPGEVPGAVFALGVLIEGGWTALRPKVS
jgi:hypothetical protein